MTHRSSRRRHRASLLSCAFLLLLTSCDESPPDPLDPCPPMRVLESPAGDPHPAPLASAPGEARAGLLAAEAIPAHPNCLLTWTAGDALLANDRIALVVEAAGSSDGLGPHGGLPIGLSTVEGGAMVAPADFGEILLGLGIYLLDADAVAVVQAGGVGKTAIVRAVGDFTSLDRVVEIFGNVFQGEFEGLRGALEYHLSPDAEHVDVFVLLDHGADAPYGIADPLILWSQANRMPPFVPELGFGGLTTSAPFVAFVDPGRTSYAYESADGPTEPFLSIANLLVRQPPSFTFEACTPARHHLGRIHVGGPGLDGVLAARARTEGAPLTEARVEVSESDGAPAEGARLLALAADGEVLTRARVPASGAVTLHLDERATEVVAHADVRRVTRAAIPSDLSAPIPLSFEETGTLEVTVTDASDGMGMPARVQLLPDFEVEAPDPRHGEAPIRDGRLALAFPSDGRFTAALSPGRYQVVLSRGFEWEAASEIVDIGAGEITPLDVALSREVPTPGVMCADLHLHTHRSFDAEDGVDLKLRGAAAEGLELPARSEHDWLAAWDDRARDLGLGEAIYGLTSLEVTTFSWGHFGIVPLDVEPLEPSGGAIEWVGRSGQELFDAAHARTVSGGPPLVILNHARSGLPILAYFDAVDFDPTDFSIGAPERWSEDFDLIEAFNASDFDANVNGVVRDWFAFLNAGWELFAVGSSDSHQQSNLPIGYPRTCVELPTDAPSVLRSMGPEPFRDALAAGRATVSGGGYLEVVGPSDTGPGERATGVGATASVRIRLRAASWIGFDRLRTYVDGTLNETVAVDATTADPLDGTLRFDADLSVPVAVDGSWVVVVADGTGDLSPVYPGSRPFAVSNPIFLER